ncbi:MAG: SAM-dependent methyltransferase [Pseudohongiellaceae bacterium]|jgi:SAM-dependent methyltransferase
MNTKHTQEHSQTPASSRSDLAEKERWEQAAVSWVDDADAIAQMTRGATNSLLSALHPRPREQILDLACGPGDPSLEIARIVGSAGRVLSTDAVAPMIAALTDRAAAAQLHWLETRHCAAQELQLDDGSFDGVSCRFGAMFFANLPEVLQRVRRALRPGGRAVFVVWGEAQHNPHFTCSSGVLADLGGKGPQRSSDVATVFELAEPGDLANKLAAAGFLNVTETAHDFTMTLADTTAATFLEKQLGRSTMLTETYLQLSEADQARAQRLVAEKAAGFEQGGELLLPARCLVVRGETPR